MKISICVPVYNAGAYIEKCAKALLEQTHPEMELIFVDDGSKDDSADKLEALGCKVIRLPKNCGRIAARFAALEAATGDYVGFVDADDWVDKDCYAKCAAAAQEADADAVVFQYVDVDPMTGESSPARKVAADCAEPKAFIEQSFYSPGFNSLCNKIFRTSLAKKWLTDSLPEIAVGEDLALTMHFLSRAKKLAFVDEPLYMYRKTANSISVECSKRTVGDMITSIKYVEAHFAVPKSKLDIMKVHALWASFRCGDYTIADLKSIADNLSIDYAHVGKVPKVKKLVLPLAEKFPTLGRQMVLMIEGIRKHV